MPENLKLEIANETVWSVKRKDRIGKFVLRSTEQRGKIIKISISLAENERDEVTFEMNPPEFNNFYGIISSFKKLIESPEHLSQNQSISEEIPIFNEKFRGGNKDENFEKNLESIRANFKKIDLNLVKKGVKKKDNEGKISLKKLNLPKKEEIITQYSNRKPPKPEKNTEKELEKKKKLSETDWDPW